MSQYETQANEFLLATNTTFKAKFLRHDYHFSEDKEMRDIFSCTLKNDNHRFTFKFGQSINQSTGDGQNLPTAYDVLTCLEKYEVTDFEDFCDNYGYNIDSRKAYKTFKAVKKEWKNVKKLFTPEEIELLQEIQ